MTVIERWDQDKKNEAYRRLLIRWDKKLSHLNEEMLHYILMRVTSILDYRAEQQRQQDLIEAE